MTKFITNFLLLVTSGKPNKIPRNATTKKKGDAEAKKAENKLKKFVGEKIDKPKVIDALDKFAQTALSSNKEILIGKIFLTCIETAKDMLLHDKENQTLIHNNNNTINGEVSIQRTNAYIGGNYSKKINSFLSGPLHSKFEKQLFMTQEDALDTKSRRELKAETGINQRGTIFLDYSTFLTIHDLRELCEFDEVKTKIMKTVGDKMFKKYDIREGENEINIKKNKKKINNDKKRVDYRSALLKTKSTIKIFNRTPTYETHVTIHLACFKSHGCDKTHTVGKLVDSIIPESLSILDKLSDTQLKKRRKSQHKELKFSDQLITDLNTQPVKLECFKDNCKIVKSWERTIPSNGHWYFNLTERHHNGVYLNKLLEFERQKVDKNMPSSFFLIIEHYGSNKATVRRIKDNELISSVYSPSQLAFEYELTISHIAKNELEKIDNILTFTEIKKINEFDDRTLTDAFYPNRKVKFNVDIENLIILDEEKSKPNAEFRLELSNSLTDAANYSELDKIKQIIEKNFSKEEADNITRDDLEFQEKSTQEEEQNDNN